MRLVNRGVFGLPLLMLAWAVLVTNQREAHPEKLFLKAQSFEKTGKIMDALALYDRIVTDYPGTPASCQSIWEMALIEYSEIGNTGKSLSLFDSLLNSCQGNELAAKAMLKIADIYEVDMRELEKANQLRYDYLEIDSGSEQSRKALFAIGNVLFKQKKFVSALAIFNNLLELNPLQEVKAQVRLRMGVILSLTNHYDKSIEHFNMVVRESQSSNFRLQAKLGLINCYELLGEYSLALDVAEKIMPDELSGKDKTQLVMKIKQRQF